MENKTDFITEWYSSKEGSRLLALGLDVTLGKDAALGKLTDIRGEIDKGVLGSIRYFRDSRGDFMGTRNNVPRVVVGVSQEAVEELARLWTLGKKKELSEHPVQRALVEQIYAQLLAMHDYAKSKGKKEVAEAYLPAISIL